MITFILGAAALGGGGYWLWNLTSGMPQEARLKYAGAAVLVAIGSALLG